MTIPKIIHYCWFSGEEKPELVKKCIDSWKKHLPDYELIEWNAKNFDMNCNPFVSEAYKARKWAFVSDYVRFHVLHEYGGIYLDGDVEVKKPFDPSLLSYRLVLSNTPPYLATCMVGSEEGHLTIKAVIECYEEMNYSSSITSPMVLTKAVLANHKHYRRWSLKNQLLDDGTAVYSSNHFDRDTGEDTNYAVHHCMAAWQDNKKTDSKTYWLWRHRNDQRIKIGRAHV